MQVKDQLKGRDFLTLMDFSIEELTYILNLAQNFKKNKNPMDNPIKDLPLRTIAMIFEKQSTRTRFSFQVAAAQLGMQSFFATPDSMQLSRGEPIKDTARVLDRYCDGLVLRTFSQKTLEQYALNMKNPVINALSDLTHPCQGLADLLTIKEHTGRLHDLNLTYVGDPWNVCHSLMIACSLFGINISIAVPKGWSPDETIIDFSKKSAQKQESSLQITSNLKDALKEADIVYTNTFHSMGHKDIEERKKAFKLYQINKKTLSYAKEAAIFMHCLPGYRGEEMTDE
ncbi:MAG: ornithine carbamoyltransferase, partial [Candidatus Thermoplasmatota archaeon]|nr:ornithine carbamoyltransferase [Candidatus Thermoplasmatota archaeon]